METDNLTANLAEVLRVAADVLAEHPDLPTPYITTSSYATVRVDLNWYLQHAADDLAEQKAMAATIVRTLGGKWDKCDWHGDEFTFRQDRDGVRFDVQVKREAVCERVVTGVETVVVPAVAARPERTEEREVVEWRCEPLLAEVTR